MTKDLTIKNDTQLAKSEQLKTEVATEQAVSRTADKVAALAVEAEELSLEVMILQLKELKQKQQDEGLEIKDQAILAEFASKINTILKSRRKSKDTPGAAIQINNGSDNRLPEIKFVSANTGKDYDS